MGIFGKDKKEKSSRRRKKKSSRKKDKRTKAEIDASNAFESFVVEEIEMGSADNFHLENVPVRKTSQARLRPNWKAIVKFQSVWLGLWALIVIAAIVFRVALLPDESLLLTTAWDASLSGNTLLLNPDARTGMQTAPLFIWLVQFGWGLFGFVEWLPHILAAVFGLLSLSVLSIMARRMWPLEAEVALYAPLLMLGCFVWAIDLTIISNHMVHLFFVCLSMYTLLLMREQVRLAWLLFGLFASIAAMTGGLVSFAYTLPVALLGPVWLAREVTSGYWYKRLSLSVLVILVFCGIWLAPVFTKLGMTDFILFLKNSVAPAAMVIAAAEKPGWWYVLLLPLMLFPWTLWPLVWSRFAGLRKFRDHGGVGFLFTWLFSTVFILSFFEVKQPHLLIPVLPAIALFTSYLLLRQDFCASKDHESPFSSMGFPIILLGGGLAILPNISKIEVLPDFLWSFSPLVGIGVSVVGITLAWMPVRKMKQQVTNIAIFSLMSSVFIIMWAWWQFGQSYQVEKITSVLASADANGESIAHLGNYHGQYGYSGRLLHTVKQVDDKNLVDWIAKHPKGILIAQKWPWQPTEIRVATPLLKSSYQNLDVFLWRTADITEAIIKSKNIK